MICGEILRDAGRGWETSVCFGSDFQRDEVAADMAKRFPGVPRRLKFYDADAILDHTECAACAVPGCAGCDGVPARKACACQGGACSCSLDWEAVSKALMPLQRRFQRLEDRFDVQLRRLTVAVAVRQILTGLERQAEGWRDVISGAKGLMALPYPDAARHGRMLNDRIVRLTAFGRRVLVARLKQRGPGTRAQGLLGQLDVEANHDNQQAAALAAGDKKPRQRRDQHDSRPGDLESHIEEQEERDRSAAIQSAVDQVDPAQVLAALVHSLWHFFHTIRHASECAA